MKSYQEEVKWIYFFIEDGELLEIYNDVWNRVDNNKKQVGCKLMDNKKILLTKIRSYSNEATDFHNEEVPKVGSNCTCLPVISLDSVLKKDESYYLKVFLKECKYIEKENKLTGHHNNGLE